jgi:DNA-binding ferritin-like protein (Dps family)
MARIRSLPLDYRIVYEEIQNYLFKVGPVSLTEGNLLSELADFFETGIATGIGVTELIGTDIATFCDDLIAGTPTYAERYYQTLPTEPRRRK